MRLCVDNEKRFCSKCNWNDCGYNNGYTDGCLDLND